MGPQPYESFGQLHLGGAAESTLLPAVFGGLSTPLSRPRKTFRWRNHFGGLKADDATRLKYLERENGTLKRLLADAELEKAALEIARGNF